MAVVAIVDGALLVRGVRRGRRHPGVPSGLVDRENAETRRCAMLGGDRTHRRKLDRIGTCIHARALQNKLWCYRRAIEDVRNWKQERDRSRRIDAGRGEVSSRIGLTHALSFGGDDAVCG